MFTKGALFVWTAACGVLTLALLVGLPWRVGMPEAMKMLGVLGVMPTLLGGTMMLSAFLERQTGHFLAYHQRCAPLLLAPGLLLMAFGLLGVAFDA